MINVYASPGSIEDLPFEGFAELDQTYKDLSIAPGDLARFGRYAIANAAILETPAAVENKGYVLTNPSQIEKYTQMVGDERVTRDFAYFREEPARLHLGHTASLPFLILEDGQGKPYLREFDDAMPLLGEDPRITREVKVRGVAGKIHNGWLISTTVATAKKEDPAYAESIEQVFYWGEDLANMEIVAKLPGIKNTTVIPATTDTEDMSLHVFGRPKPHTSYLHLPGDITTLTKEAVEDENRAIFITKDFLPEGVHGGPNFVKDAGPGHLEIDGHEAYLKHLPVPEETPEAEPKAELHYRLSRYGYELPRRGLPKGRLIPLGVIATRVQFPDAPAKTPENGVASYDDVLYGAVGTVNRKVAVGRAGRMLVGASDSRVGVADVIRVG